MKKKLFLVVLLSFGLTAIAQTQLSKWRVNGMVLNFLTPVPTSSATVPPAPINVGTNCRYDNLGNLQFYIEAGKLYNKFGTQLATLNNAVADEYGIIPKPSNALSLCGPTEFYIVVADVPPLVGVVKYGTLDLTANGGLGSFTWASGPLCVSGNPQLCMAVSRETANGTRYLYMNANGSLDVFLVTSSGISPVSVTPSIGIGGIGGEMELSNNGDKLAYINGFSICVLNLSGGLPTGTPTCFNQNFGNTLKGLEFDYSGNYLYYSTSDNSSPGVYVKDLTQPWASSVFINGTASFTGMLEKAYNGVDIICGSASQVRAIYTPTMSLRNWPALNFPGDFMPDQIDGENYTPNVISINGTRNRCNAGGATMTVTIPPAFVNQGYYLDVTNTNTATSITVPVTQTTMTFNNNLSTTTTFNVELIPPVFTLCTDKAKWTTRVLSCGIAPAVVFGVNNSGPTNVGKVSFEGMASDPAFEQSHNIQSSWIIEEINPQTNEAVFTLDPACWMIQPYDNIKFKGFDADVDYTNTSFDCTLNNEGLFSADKDYLVTRKCWGTGYGPYVSIVYVEKGHVKEQLGKKGSSQSTGINETSSDKNIFNIYPNPSKGLININSSDLKAEHIEVYNITGKIVYQRSNESGNDLSSINLSELPEGIYTIKVSGGGKEQVQRIVLE